MLEKDQHKAKFAHLNIDYPGFRSPFHSPLNVPAFKHRIQLPTTWLLVLFESSLLINCAFSNQILNQQSIRSRISSVNTCNQPTNLLNIHQSSESEIESRRQRHQKFSPSLFVFVRRNFYLLVYANFKFIYCFFISFFVAVQNRLQWILTLFSSFCATTEWILAFWCYFIRGKQSQITMNIMQ